jgi:aminoglycoside phosphotransferase (APT) family kinase protein
MMFGSDFRMAAVLDWDQMSLADPRHDLAWLLYFDEFNSTRQGIAPPEGMGARTDHHGDFDKGPAPRARKVCSAWLA